MKHVSLYHNIVMVFSRFIVNLRVRRKTPINTKITDELNILDPCNKILMSSSQWKHQILRMGDTRIPKKILIYSPIRGQGDHVV
jgi:hypothetical protein